jgi:hypothetical protein
MNRANRAEQVAFYRALAEQAKAMADQYEAAFASGIGDEYRAEGTAPTWRVKDLVTISGRVTNAAVRISNPGDFLAWVKAHRPEDVETIERVKPAVQSAILKGCHPGDDDTSVVTAGGDEIAGVEWMPGGVFQGVSFKFDPSAKEAYAELARTALDQLTLSPAGPEQPIPARAMTAPAGDPWGSAPSDPWDDTPNPWVAPAE